MTDIKNKRLTLFILEIIILGDIREINENFTDQINDFIYKYYDNNKELFELVFDEKLLKEFIENRWEVLPQEVIIKLIKYENGIDGYINLVASVGYEIDQKINFLAIKFLDYYNELLALYNAKAANIYQRILQ